MTLFKKKILLQKYLEYQTGLVIVIRHILFKNCDEITSIAFFFLDVAIPSVGSVTYACIKFQF